MLWLRVGTLVAAPTNPGEWMSWLAYLMNDLWRGRVFAIKTRLDTVTAGRSRLLTLALYMSIKPVRRRDYGVKPTLILLLLQLKHPLRLFW
jgi:hypothetical protein